MTNSATTNTNQHSAASSAVELALPSAKSDTLTFMRGPRSTWGPWKILREANCRLEWSCRRDDLDATFREILAAAAEALPDDHPDTTVVRQVLRDRYKRLAKRLAAPADA